MTATAERQGLGREERHTLTQASGLNGWDLPIKPLERVNAFPEYWTDGGRWRVEAAKVAGHRTERRRGWRKTTPAEDALGIGHRGRRLTGAWIEVIIPTMTPRYDSPDWEVYDTGRRVAIVSKVIASTPDEAVLYVLGTRGWRFNPLP